MGPGKIQYCDCVAYNYIVKPDVIPGSIPDELVKFRDESQFQHVTLNDNPVLLYKMTQFRSLSTCEPVLTVFLAHRIHAFRECSPKNTLCEFLRRK